MLRFSTVALPLLVLLLALFGLVTDVLSLGPRAWRLHSWQGGSWPPGSLTVAAWLLESLGLLIIFLLVSGRYGRWWLDGLVSGWAAWIFRGPLLVVTLAPATRYGAGEWWALAFAWWLLYTVCGLALGWLARRWYRRDG